MISLGSISIWCVVLWGVGLGLGLGLGLVVSDPQMNMLNKGCSQYNATNFSIFNRNLNATFVDLRAQFTSNNYFATAQRADGTDPVYALAQCRNYLSNSDCIACFDSAAARIRNCSAANGARVIYDGCFLRYESNSFYSQGTLEGNFGICGNQTASSAAATGFESSGQALLQDLKVATPRINGFFAAITKEVVVGNGVGQIVYGVAQCAGTVDRQGCQDCLDVAYNNIEKCLPSTEGRAIDAGCFLRYSEEAFFADNQTTNILPFLKEGGSSRTRAIIGGVVGGGILKNGKIVAVKRLAISASRSAKADFEGEVKLISNVHHRNLIRLLGCSSNGPELILVYEYMPNSSLDKFLFGEGRGSLNWKQRFDIIIGTARGLAYLHEDFHVCIIHRDIKSANILLDGDFLPKIADFGLARLLPGDQSHLSTKFAGTLGYTAPEYAIHGQLSEKVDTYSFGIVVLEIISGLKSGEMTQDPEAEFLLKLAWKLYESDRHLELVDDNVDPNEYNGEEVKKIIELALMCTQSLATSRPTMSEVVGMLKSKGNREHTRPTRPVLADSHQRFPDDTSTSGSSTSNATASISHISAR
ncbi:cysteine-rich receptor-like protein kinase 2 isoform X3 [Tripterygium wilfordii]|uniref:Cysteine-rich receptor-like protein kinase 2 isoform X3 n=1 Tax=Tripterygium wilfordii TaxID=458696 RepID=A0A7J7D2P0_TRIWF|nr:cysteine-rich receptor-like protein kinase 2 isoform X3 [Tripterygium wilfordii]